MTSHKLQTFIDTAVKGDLKQIESLLANDHDLLNQEGSDGLTALARAAWNGKLDVVKYLHQQGADIHTKSCSGMTPLMYAASYGWTDIVTYLLENKAKIDDVSRSHKTALMYALSSEGANYTATVKKLLTYQPALDIRDEFDTPILMYAFHLDTDACLDLLLDANVDTNQTDDGNTVLHKMCQGSYVCTVERIKKLMTKGIHIDAVNSHGDTAPELLIKSSHPLDKKRTILKELVPLLKTNKPLANKMFSSAIESSNLENVALLTESGLELDDSLKREYYILLFLKGHISITELTNMSLGEDKPVDKEGNTLLMQLIKDNKYDLAIKLLPLSDLSAKNHKGVSVVDLIFGSYHFNLIKEAITNGLYPNQKLKNGMPLIVDRVRDKKVSLLLAQHHANLDYVDAQENTLLMLAAKDENTPLMNFILQSNYPYINKQNKDGYTALAYAICEGMNGDAEDYADIVTNLLAAGEDPYLKYNDGYRAENVIERARNHYLFGPLLKPYMHDDKPKENATHNVSANQNGNYSPTMFREKSAKEKALTNRDFEVKLTNPVEMEIDTPHLPTRRA